MKCAGLVFCWGSEQIEPQINEELAGRCYSHLSAGYEDSTVMADGSIFSLGDSGFADILREVNGVCSVAYGDGHVLAVTSSGKLHCAGNNMHGQVGTGHALRNPSSELVCPPVMLQRKVVAIAAGRAHSACLTDTGDMYTWGRGFEGQLGHDPREPLALVPKYVKAFRGNNVTKIACGDLNTAAITQQGLYTWGDGTSGQLGHSGKKTMVALPGYVEAILAPVRTVAIGSGHMVASDEDGVVWSWGLNTLKQLGHSEGQRLVREPQHPLLPVHSAQNPTASDFITQVVAGPHSTICVSSTGVVFSWGAAEHGLLGFDTGDDTCKMPSVVRAVEGYNVERLVCSRHETIAFVPRSIVKVVPDCALVSGGTDLKMYGHGFPTTRCDLCQVKFVTSDGEEQIKDAEYNPQTGEICVQTPCFSTSGRATVSVMFDDSDFSSVLTNSAVEVYNETNWLSLSVALGPTEGGTQTEVCAEKVVVSEYLSARVRPLGDGDVVHITDLGLENNTFRCCMPPCAAGPAHLEIALNGTDYETVNLDYTYYTPPVFGAMTPQCTPHQIPASIGISGTGLFVPDPEDLIQVKFECDDGREPLVVPGGMRVVGSKQSIHCEVPAWESGGFMKVSVSLNNQNFTHVPGCFAVYEPMTKIKFIPASGPMKGGTSVKLSAATNLIDQPTLKVRINNANKRMECSGRHLGEAGIDWLMPAWREPPLVPDGEATEPPTEAEKPPAIEGVEIGVAINGVNYQPTFLPFTFYEDPVFSAINPNAAALAPEEPQRFVLERGEQAVHSNEEMRVRLVWKAATAEEGQDQAPDHVMEYSITIEPPAEDADEGTLDTMSLTVPVESEAKEGECEVHVATNGQQFVDTGLKIAWK